MARSVCRQKELDGRFFEEKAITRYGDDPWIRKSRYRAQANCNLSNASDYWVAARFKIAWPPRLRVPEKKTGGLCRRMLLAWLSGAWPKAAFEPWVLGGQNFTESRARSQCEPAAARMWMACPKNLGTRFGKEV